MFPPWFRPSLTLLVANVRLSLLFKRMRAVDLIRKKRDAGEHSREEIDYLISAYTRGDIPDYQMAAWLMAAWLRGLNPAEATALTEAMLHSGEVLDLSDVPGKKVDKHSTGGVGDNASLILAPIVAAGGVNVPMISGRGLGHTGGTLDKLEAIPGFNTALTLSEFRRVLRECGMALIGQTAEIAPADKKIYALRDATSTVESIPLICASIMSKKLAEGIDALVLDVKTGSGAFMQKEEDAVRLAQVMVDTAQRMGKKAVALLTDMNQPLGKAAGHSNEVIEAFEILKGRGPKDLRDLSIELSAWMFYLGERTTSVNEGRRLAESLVASGQALETFQECIRLQGGDERVVENYSLLPGAKYKTDVTSHEAGYLAATRCTDMGIALAMLEGGRAKKEDRIDHGVSLEFHKRIGDKVEKGEPLVTIHYNNESKLPAAKKLLESSYILAGSAPAIPPQIHQIIGGK
jgi:pyrimidine-nucleoside phosphorylase